MQGKGSPDNFEKDQDIRPNYTF